MKRSIALFLSLLIALWMGVPCYAAENNRFLQEVELEENSLVIYSDAVKGDDNFSITLGGEELPFEMQTVEESDKPVTFFCLVDISGTMSGMPMALTKETLTALSSHMREQDNMVVSTFDNHVSVGMPLETGEELNNTINNISLGEGDTNLYSAIIESINLLSSVQAFHTKKCLIIFSDGGECQDNGATETEVHQAVWQADFPLYTVATMTNNNQLAGGKILGSFGRTSAGGEHFTTAKDEGAGRGIRTDISGTDIAETIWTDMSGGAVVTADLSNYVPDKERNEVALKVTLSTGGTDVSETKNILVDDLLKVISTDSTETGSESVVGLVGKSAAKPIAEPVAGEAPAPAPAPKPQTSPMLIAAGLIVIFLIVILLIAVLRKRSKKKLEHDDNVNTPVIPDETKPLNEESDKGEQSEETDAGVYQGPKKNTEIPVFMLEIPYGRNPVSFNLASDGKKLTVGRNDRADFILNGADSQLSGIHFSLVCSAGKYYVLDEDSTNGTLLNGVNIAGKGWVPLISGDKLRAGEMEYRIMFGEEALQNSSKNDAQ